MGIRNRGKRAGIVAGLLLAACSIAPAPPKADDAARADPLQELKKARYDSAIRSYDESWIYYRQARTDVFFTYSWSRIVMTCEGDLSDKKADRLKAFENHLGRMVKLQNLVNQVRRIGFQRSIDIVSSDYFTKEAQYWLAKAKTEEHPVIPPTILFPYP
jgi:hypothetical protein